MVTIDKLTVALPIVALLFGVLSGREPALWGIPGHRQSVTGQP